MESSPIILAMTLPKIPDVEMVAIEGLQRLGHFLGIAEEKVGEARILVTEAVINAFEHSGAADAQVEVEFTMTKEELTILVRDYGKGFEPSSVKDPVAGGKEMQKRGWGLKLMKSMSDDFRIDSNETGTRITLKKKLV
ncbi:MAG: ATP-binding protein [bacterium]